MKSAHALTARPGVAERVARGRAARAAVPRSSHGVYEPRALRSDPLLLLEAQATTRVPELVPIRYGRMLTSPLAFYRGAAAIMASDLAATPCSGLDVQCCGDAHLSNFGVFASPERRLVFDVNDFDETLPGPWEWDIKRLSTSMMVAARECGASARDRERIVLGTAAEYRTRMAQFAVSGNLEVWYSRVEIDAVAREFAPEIDARTRKRARKVVANARTRDSLEALSKLTRTVDGVPRIVSRPPLIVPVDELVETERHRTLAALHGILETYGRSLRDDQRVLLDRYELADAARKVVGVGSVGTHAWIALFLGRANSDPLFLQIKEAEQSVLEAFLGPSAYGNAGQRVVEGQRLMQATSDIFLGWLDVERDVDGRRRDYYVRQLRDWKGSAVIATMTPDELAGYGRLCGATLARAHARSGDRVAIAAYLGTGAAFDRAIVAFSDAYADQNERDYAGLGAAVKAGRISAVTDLSERLAE